VSGSNIQDSSFLDHIEAIKIKLMDYPSAGSLTSPYWQTILTLPFQVEKVAIPTTFLEPALNQSGVCLWIRRGFPFVSFLVAEPARRNDVFQLPASTFTVGYKMLSSALEVLSLV
jgi:hypothetical protein